MIFFVMLMISWPDTQMSVGLMRQLSQKYWNAVTISVMLPAPSEVSVALSSDFT
jgi:hypothetical protein